MRGSPGTCGGRDGGTVGRGLLAGVLAGALLAGAADGLLAQVEGQPPERKVEERPRTPELERPQEAGAAHEVRRGDTLWDLAGRYLSDPLRWPAIFELNTDVVEDPHWIYPGERLRLPEGAARDAARVAGAPERRAEPPRREAPGEAAPEPPQEARGARRPVSGFGGPSVFDRSPSSGDVLGPLGVEEFVRSPLVSTSDFHRAPFLADPEAMGPTAVTVRKLEQNPLGLSLPATARRHHQMVLELNGLEAEEGQRLQAIRWKRSLGRSGRIASPVALLEVRQVSGGSARVAVLDVYGDYQVGDPVIPAEAFEFDPASRLEPVESGLVAGLIGYEVEQVLPGRGDMVFLDVGSGAGVGIGDEFAVFAPDEVRPASAAWSDRLAVVRVVRVRPSTATALVVDLQDVGVEPGAPVRLVSRATGG